MQADKLAYRIDEAVNATGVSRTQIYAELRAKRLSAVKYGTRTLILREELERFLKSLNQAA